MKKIIIAGKGASGKNVLADRLESRGFRRLVSHTTRPMRPGETDGKEYHFVPVEEFGRMLADNMLLEHQMFGDHWYGVSKDEWEKSDVAIMAPQGVGSLRALGLRGGCFVIYINTPYHIRKARLSARNNLIYTEDVLKRLSEDETRFSGFTDYDMIIENPNF